MPFKSDKQRAWMFANKPEMAREWADKYNTGGHVMGRGLLDKMDDDITITKKTADGASVTIKSPKGTQVDLSGILGNMLEEGMVEGPDMGPVADNVNARLTPGEHVINRPAAEKYRPLLEAINEEGKMMLAMGGHIPGYAGGGQFPSKTRSHDELVYLRKLLETLEPGTRDYEMVRDLIVGNPKGYNVGGQVSANDRAAAVSELVRRARAGDTHAQNILQTNGIAWQETTAPAVGGTTLDESVTPLPSAQQGQPVPDTSWTPEAPAWTFNPKHDVSVAPEQPSATPWLDAAKNLQMDDGSGTAAQLDGLVDNDTKAAAADIVGGSETPQDVLKKLDMLGDEAKTLEEKRRSMKLFALGLSMLGGKNAANSASIANNIANASDHKIEELYARRKDLLSAVDAKFLKEQGYETAAASSGYSRPFNIEYRDESGALEVRAGRLGPDGNYLIQGDDGEWVPAPTDARVTNRSADPAIEIGPGGIPNADSYSEKLGIPSFTFQREGEQKVYGYALRAIVADRNLAEVEKEIPTGKLASLYAGLANWARTNATGSISAATLNSLIGDAGLTQYGRELQKYLQAILRTDTGAAYTGTEIADYLSAFGVTPGEAIDANTLKRIQDGRAVELVSLAGRAGKAAPYLIGLLDDKYDLPAFDRLPRGSVGSVEAGAEKETNTTETGVTWSVE